MKNVRRKHSARVPIPVGTFAELRLPEIGGELRLLVEAARHVGVGRHHLALGLSAPTRTASISEPTTSGFRLIRLGFLAARSQARPRPPRLPVPAIAGWSRPCRARSFRHVEVVSRLAADRRAPLRCNEHGASSTSTSCVSSSLTAASRASRHSRIASRMFSRALSAKW